MTPNAHAVLTNLCKAWFKEDWQLRVEQFRNDLLNFDIKGTRDWLQEHKNSQAKRIRLEKFLQGGMNIKPLHDVNVHVKMESLLKDEPILDWTEQKSRIIVWQEYEVAAIFSPVFTKVKERLKSMLKHNVIYADGKRPDEIAAAMRTTKNLKCFLENDLEKQDKQTDAPLIEVEFMLYRLLGVSEKVLNAYRIVHNKWRYQGKYTRGDGEAMRLTGQATTALGNVITNMQVHADFKLANNHIIEMTLMLGDDILFALSGNPKTKMLRTNIRRKYNM
jgi:hypothetical protein